MSIISRLNTFTRLSVETTTAIVYIYTILEWMNQVNILVIFERFHEVERLIRLF